MKTKILLVASVFLNIALLGTVALLSKQNPEQNPIPADARIVATSGYAEGVGFTDRTRTAVPFGTVIEALLPAPPEAGRPELLDLETGRRLREPDSEYFAGNARANIAWIRTNGLDISGVVLSGRNFMCICYYMAVVPVNSQRWEQATPAEIIADPELARIRDPKRPFIFPARDKSDTYLFRTAEGTPGILQVVGLTPNNRNVKIRYKLVQAAVVAQ